MISLNETEPFTPEWLEGTEGAPVYHVRVGSVAERGNLEADISGEHRAGRVFGFEMAAAFENGVNALLADDPEKARLIELVHQESGGDPVTGLDRQLLTKVRDVLAEHWPEYAALLRQTARRREILPIIAFKRFVVAIERGDDLEELPRGFDGTVTDAALQKIDHFEMMRVGNFAYELLFGGGEKRNFRQPSKSDAAQETSSSADLSKADGKSGASAGKKTRASRSRRGSGQS